MLFIDLLGDSDLGVEWHCPTELQDCKVILKFRAHKIRFKVEYVTNFDDLGCRCLRFDTSRQRLVDGD